MSNGGVGEQFIAGIRLCGSRKPRRCQSPDSNNDSDDP
jgi:hypothetical protein